MPPCRDRWKRRCRIRSMASRIHHVTAHTPALRDPKPRLRTPGGPCAASQKERSKPEDSRQENCRPEDRTAMTKPVRCWVVEHGHCRGHSVTPEVNRDQTRDCRRPTSTRRHPNNLRMRGVRLRDITGARFPATTGRLIGLKARRQCLPGVGALRISAGAATCSKRHRPSIRRARAGELKCWLTSAT